THSRQSPWPLDRTHGVLERFPSHPYFLESSNPAKQPQKADRHERPVDRSRVLVCHLSQALPHSRSARVGLSSSRGSFLHHPSPEFFLYRRGYWLADLETLRGPLLWLAGRYKMWCRYLLQSLL